jgi:GT2 family glycosyltransferase
MRKGEGDNALARSARLISACGPSAFFRRELLQSVGGINQSLHYKMDTELWLRFREAGEYFRRTGRYAWALRLHEDAKVGSQSFAPAIAEKHRAGIAKEAAALQQRYHLPKNRASRFVSRVIASAPKLLSRAWWSSKRDHKHWQGRHIRELIGALR